MLYLSLDWQVRMQRELFQHRQTEFFEEPGGIAADRRYQIGCHVFLFSQACLLFPLSSQPKDDSKVCFSKVSWASF